MTLLVTGGPAYSGHKPALKERPKDWTCANGHPNRGYAVRCMTDGCQEKRP